MQIGICGTFDVKNYGDLLFPLIAEAELSRRLGQIELHRFSYFEKAVPAWPYRVTSVTQLPKLASDLDGMLIGGGHLVRFDKGVALGYLPPEPNLHHPTGYWLTPALICLDEGCPVVWNALGASTEIPDWAHPLLELALGRSAYVAVRDELSRATLTPFAAPHEIVIVPDTCFGVARLLPSGRPSAAFSDLRRSLNLTRPYFGIQATPELDAFVRFVAQHPSLFSDFQFVALPVAPDLGDDSAILSAAFPNLVTLPDYPHPLLMAELISSAIAVVGVSLHLAITAIAFAVPVFRPAWAFEAKYSVLSSWANVHSFGSHEELSPDWFVERLSSRDLDDRLREIQRSLDAHWDRIAASFASGRRNPRRPGKAIWQQLPILLEAKSAGLNVQIEERDARLADADRNLRRLTSEVENRDRWLAAADKDLRRLIGELEDRNRRLAAADKDLGRLIGELEDRDRRLTDADKDVRWLIGELEDRNRRLADADKDLRRLIGELEDRNRRLADADKDLRRLIGELEDRGGE